MNKLRSIFILLLVLYACSSKDEGTKIVKDSPQYEFAKILSENLPALDPDSNKVLISTNRFTITTGSVTEALYLNFKNKLDQLRNLSGIRLKKIYSENAELLGKKKMLLYAADDADIKNSDSEIDSILQIEFSKAGGKEKYIEYLTKNDISLEFIIKNIQNSMHIQKYLENAVSHLIEIKDEEVQQKLIKIRYVSVRHILLNTKDNNETEKKNIRKKLESILNMAKQGQKFSELAHKYSEDNGSKENGGLYNNFERGDMVQPFEDIAFSTPIGEISDIFETEFGFHILKVIDRKKDSRSADEIKAELIKQKQDIEMPKHIEQLKKYFEFKKMDL